MTCAKTENICFVRFVLASPGSEPYSYTNRCCRRSRRWLRVRCFIHPLPDCALTVLNQRHLAQTLLQGSWMEVHRTHTSSREEGMFKLVSNANQLMSHYSRGWWVSLEKPRDIVKVCHSGRLQMVRNRNFSTYISRQLLDGCD